ncbi:MAG: hypothetical protein KDJ39_05875 [Gammaproteobacteria bacterium]|nr:hypothetical protein [Gammaproteobacteria bacterium]
MAVSLGAVRLIVEHIRMNAIGLTEVSTSKRLAGYRSTQDVPLNSVYVFPGSSEILDHDGDDNIQSEFEIYKTIICVSHLNDPDDSDWDTADEKAGVILRQLQPMLVGWKPADGYKPMKYAGREEPYFDDNGYAEFPALWKTGFLITGNY